MLSCGHRIACSHNRIAFSTGGVESQDLPPQVIFADTNVPGLPSLPDGYTHTEFLRRFVLRGKSDEHVPDRILCDVNDGQKLYQKENEASPKLTSFFSLWQFSFSGHHVSIVSIDSS